MIIWSLSFKPTLDKRSIIPTVASTSLLDGATTPDGWLCINIRFEQLLSREHLMIFRTFIGDAFIVPSLIRLNPNNLQVESSHIRYSFSFVTPLKNVDAYLATNSLVLRATSSFFNLSTSYFLKSSGIILIRVAVRSPIPFTLHNSS